MMFRRLVVPSLVPALSAQGPGIKAPGATPAGSKRNSRE
jgi:hypothetical protein